ncbi:MAG TPA: acyl-CoA desaturase [Gammaproteobacteria bacterium]|nr:acyl-CoA desaturase [Gammaproteobacteria bacterium]|tara:strand:- start:1289 stop:2434 length:1146 start_codon:yes stop_codon:yes gene_type:complete
MEKAPINWTNMLLFSLTPLLAVILVPLYGYYDGYDLYEWMVFLGMMLFCGLSITAGYHRMWSHKSFRGHPALRLVFALGGACALQNDVMHWASDHRRHHRHVDHNDLDPYSAGRGFWFSHIGWILRDYDSGKEDFSNIKDIQQDKIALWQHQNYLLLVLLTNIALPAVLGYLHGDIIACLLLGGILRLVMSQHVTYTINSIAHMWGKQTYSDASSARDNPLLALITYGEGYHNYHHTFQWDYRNGIKWWHFDPTKWLIRSFSWVGLTKDLKRTDPARVETARLRMQYQQARRQFEFGRIPDNLRTKLEQEYEQFQQLLKEWNMTRQQWLEARERRIQETLAQWERMELRDSYKEMKFALKVQRKRWHELLRSLQSSEATAA